MRAAWILAVLFASCAGAPPLEVKAEAGDDGLTDLDRRVARELSAVEEAGPLRLHHRPGDFTPGQLAEDAAANLAHFNELEAKLGTKYRGQIHLFLYRDGEDLRATTEVDNDIAFSTGTVSVHQTHDFRGVHELTHVFAVQFPCAGDGSEPDGFVVEGLATALARSDQDVDLHDWAAVYRDLGRLPALLDLRRGWMREAPAGVHPYHVAGSFVGYLVERFGIEPVKRWYVDSTEAYKHFGSTFPALERDWLAWLDAREVPSESVAHVRTSLGVGSEPLPDTWARAGGTSLFDGGSLDALELEKPELWKVEGGLLVGSNDGPWTVIHSRADFGPDIGLRVRFRLRSGNAVQLRLNRTSDATNQGIFARWCTYLSDHEGYVPNEGVKVPQDAWCEAVFVNQAGRGRLYLNGEPVLDREGALYVQEGRVGFCLERGVVEVAEITAFAP